ncbi:terminase small subunit [Sphingobacterium griseoflavum]|uniref:Terminase n=1 Tax=Sphingobacterium griseoflavum TaxID=1474952 RepID=A0ABQ3HU51_9SPHI|nr:terminase small subunit [Sphingobacterium griseoflavum]GHE34826.1 terminase [Sphingobacterium griseoflavum]
MALTDKQQRFVDEYMVDLNATQAAIRAGYSPDTARQMASENLSKPDIQEAIQIKKQKISEATGITAERVLAEYAKIAFSDVRNVLTVDGGLKDASEWGDDAAGAVAAVKSFEVTSSDGEKLGTNREVKMYDKLRALEAIGKHIGLFEKDNKQKQAEVINHINLGSGVKPPEDE